MTDKNGKPLKVGDKVTHQEYGVGEVTHVVREMAQVVHKSGGFVAPCQSLTLVEPKPEPVGYKPDGTPIDLRNSAVEHIGTNVFEALGRENAEELFRKAELVSRVRDIMERYEGTERAWFQEIADEILKAVSAYHEQT